VARRRGGPLSETAEEPAARPVEDVQVTLLCPFDIDFEPDLAKLARDDVSIARVQPGPAGIDCVEIARTTAGPLCLGDRTIARECVVHAHVYRFGTGIVRVQFDRDDWDLAGMAELSVRAEELVLDRKPLTEHARDLGAAIRKRLEPYAFAKYETLLEAVEVYPVLEARTLPGPASTGERFCEENRRLLATIVSGDARRGKASSFTLDEYPVRNVGPLEADVVAVRESGAFVHAHAPARGARGAEEALADARKIAALIELAYAEYWSLRSVDFMIQHLQDQAYTFTSGFLARDPVVTLGAVTQALYRARELHMAISNIVDDFIEVPAIGNDGYLDAFFRRARDVFGVRERSRVAQERLEDLEKSYETVHSMINERRLMTLEILVLIVIVIELGVAFAEFIRGAK
jgi:hypothetical protein